MPPNDFSNRTARWVYSHHANSVVYLEFVPDLDAVLEQWDVTHPIVHLEGDEAIKEERRKELAGQTKYCTGSFVSMNLDPYGHFILTSAHVLDPIFTAAMPITPDLLNQMYQPRLLCGHHEDIYLENAGAGVNRNPILGMIHLISCENDMMLLRFTTTDMERHCLLGHRELIPAFQFPTPLKQVMMISWPGHGRRWASVIGTVSQQHRERADLDENNLYGFTTQLSEVDITSESGSSGAPLLNRHGHIIGILHGGNKSFSYFVGFTELTQTITAWRATGVNPIGVAEE